MVQSTEERLRSTYSARNEDAEARTLVIEHPVRAGWTLGGTVKPDESTAGLAPLPRDDRAKKDGDVRRGGDAREPHASSASAR